MLGNNNKKNNSDELNIKEVSSKLDISEATVRKYLKDFDLDCEKGSGAKAVVSDETFQALSEIAKLRANGLSIQEIKELKSQKPSKNILDEIEETESTQKEEIKKEEESETKTEVAEDLEDKNLLEEQDEEALDEDTQDEAESEELIKESAHEEGTEGAPERRRRGFNYRYVERQISNDSKRVGSLRLRLRNSNLSVQERLFVEESLERRILFLDGWKHILRWISK